MGWLAWLMGIASAFMVLATIRIPRPKPQAAGPKEPEEVLTPVVVQDVGEPPYLYPPNFDMKINSKWTSEPWWERVVAGFGSGWKSIYRHTFGKGSLDTMARSDRQGPSWRLK